MSDQCPDCSPWRCYPDCHWPCDKEIADLQAEVAEVRVACIAVVASALDGGMMEADFDAARRLRDLLGITRAEVREHLGYKDGEDDLLGTGWPSKPKEES